MKSGSPSNFLNSSIFAWLMVKKRMDFRQDMGSRVHLYGAGTVISILTEIRLIIDQEGLNLH